MYIRMYVCIHTRVCIQNISICLLPPRCVKSALTADMEVFVDGLCRLLTATLLQTVELRLMRTLKRNFTCRFQRRGLQVPS